MSDLISSLADQIIELINASPRSPTKEEIVDVLRVDLEHFKDHRPLSVINGDEFDRAKDDCSVWKQTRKDALKLLGAQAYGHEVDRPYLAHWVEDGQIFSVGFDHELPIGAKVAIPRSLVSLGVAVNRNLGMHISGLHGEWQRYLPDGMTVADGLTRFIRRV